MAKQLHIFSLASELLTVSSGDEPLLMKLDDQWRIFPVP